MRNNMQNHNRKKILRLNSVVSITGIPKSSLYALMKAGGFPKPIPLSSRSVGWLEDEVEQWIEARIAQRKG
jgi:prophage regulatory protein